MEAELPGQSCGKEKSCREYGDDGGSRAVLGDEGDELNVQLQDSQGG